MGGSNETSASRSDLLGDATLCLAFALLLRIATFGDPNLHMDEAFYFYVGLEMNQGAVPYVDIWDRKPLGLFILYSLFASISSSVLAYQIPAWLFASYTAWVISRIVALYGSRLAGLLAAGAYLALLLPLNGHGGQSPIFYNALVASAVWLILLADNQLKQGRVAPGVWAAMVLAGLAITIKQTSLFEAVFLGLWVVWRLWQSSMPFARLARYTVGLAAVGATPWLAIAAWYYLAGHWDEYWFAMVTSNLARPSVPNALSHNIPIFFHSVGLLLVAAISALALSRRYPKFHQRKLFWILWLVAASIGYLSVPIFIDHYAIPLLVPLCCLAAAHFGSSRVGTILGVTIILSSIAMINPFDFRAHDKSREMFDAISVQISSNPGNGVLFIYDGPMLSYANENVDPGSSVVFPWHVVSESERGTTFIEQRTALAEIISKQPSLVIATDDWKPEGIPGANAVIQSYISERCELLYTGIRSQRRHPPREVYLYGRCNEPR